MVTDNQDVLHRPAAPLQRETLSEQFLWNDMNFGTACRHAERCDPCRTDARWRMMNWVWPQCKEDRSAVEPCCCPWMTAPPRPLDAPTPDGRKA